MISLIQKTINLSYDTFKRDFAIFFKVLCHICIVNLHKPTLYYFQNILTILNLGANINKSLRVAYAGVAEQADAQDLKSCEINFSYRFDPGLRHHLIVAEWSSLVARRAHNPKVMWFKSHLRNQVVLTK